MLGAVGVVSPGGGEVGPFQAVEQASLTETVTPLDLPSVMSLFHIVGYAGQGLGAIGAGLLIQWLSRDDGLTNDHSVSCIWVYTLMSMLLMLIYLPLSHNIESLHPRLGFGESKNLARRISSSFFPAIRTPYETFWASQHRASDSCCDSRVCLSSIRSLVVSFCNRSSRTGSALVGRCHPRTSASC